MWPRKVSRGPNSTYHEPRQIFCTSLDELRDKCGEDGDVAVLRARISAAIAWKMHSEDFTGGMELGEYLDLICYRLGMPRIDNQAFRPAIIYASPSEQQRVTQVAEGVLSAWEQAGSPRLQHSIENTQKLILASLRKAEKREEAREALQEPSHAIRLGRWMNDLFNQMERNPIAHLRT